MRRVILCLLAISASLCAQASRRGVQAAVRSVGTAPVVLQGAFGRCTSTGTCTATFASATHTGSTILVAFTAGIPEAVLDCAGAGPCTSGTNPFVLDVLVTGKAIARASDIVGQSQHSVTVNLAQTVSYFTVMMAEVQGLSPLSPVGQYNTGSGNSTSPTCTVTAGAANELLFGYFGGGTSITGASGTSVAIVPTPHTGDVALYKVVEAGSQTMNATQTSGAWTSLCQAYHYYTPAQIKNRGYWPVGLAGSTTAITQTAAWELSPPHTLSIAKLDLGGFVYWGYYGCEDQNYEGMGLARSNDLSTWTKYTTDGPLLTHVRWPSVAQSGETLYVVYTSDVGGVHLRLASSPASDGLNWTELKDINTPGGGSAAANPTLFHDPVGGWWYLYFYYGSAASNDNNIVVRKAATIPGLDAAPNVTLLHSSDILAAPQVVYRDGLYFLAVETYPGLQWTVPVYSSAAPDSGFTLLPGAEFLLGGSPLRSQASACAMQYIFGDTLHLWTCNLLGSTWTIAHRSVPLGSRSKAVY